MLKNTKSFFKILFIFLLALFFNVYLTLFIFVKTNPNYKNGKIIISFNLIFVILLIIEYLIFIWYQKKRSSRGRF